jgi:hypothetical protein
MSQQKRIIIEYNINQPIFRLISLQNNNLLVVLKTLIKCLKSPDYSIENALDISINNQGIDAVCLWKNNIIIVKTNQKFYFIHINEGNYNFNIISEFNLLENIMLKSQKMISLNNKSNLLINTIGKFIILNEHQPNLLQIEKVFFGINANSFIQIRKNEIVCNSSEKKKVYFINSKKGNIISTINNINIYILDIDSFCLVNKNVLAMGGDLRDGIYLFDINKRELINHYKEDYRGYNCLLSLGNNKFLGESYCGRCYGESDDEEEELYCTHFFEFNEKENKIAIYKYSVDRIYDLKRINFICLK